MGEPMTDTAPDSNAPEGVDYEFWSRMSGWTVAEAAALLLDIDPDRLPEESEDRGTRGWEYRRLFRLLDRARKMEELSSPMTPREFLTWASSNGIKPPEPLEATVRAGKPHRNWKTRYQAMRRERDSLLAEVEALNEKVEDDLNPRVRQTLLKLVGGMARAKFKHVTGNRNTVSSIQHALENVDWPLTGNSIRTYLNEADVLYDQEHPKNSNEI
jgi:hypothetical protein